MQKDYVIVLVTTKSKQEAEKIAQQLLGKQLVACVNIIGPVFSFFRWSGNIEKAEEYIALMKSRKDLFKKLEKNVKALHSYEVPEIVAIPIIEGSKPYMVWLESCLGKQN